MSFPISTFSRQVQNIKIFGKDFLADSFTNIPQSIIEKTNRILYKQKTHPLSLLKNKLITFLTFKDFQLFENFIPIVTPKSNFDDLLIPPAHISRTRTDSFFINSSHLLRTHTTAHYADILTQQHQGNFVIVGDVYRRDTVDKRHYPVFHQMDIVRFFPADSSDSFIVQSLQSDIVSLLNAVFGRPIDFRWTAAYFPFTEASLEIEIRHNNEWIELLGCGILRQEILSAGAGITNKRAYAFGLGLERLAMILLDIQDIRMFWSEDERFLGQYSDGMLKKFTPFSIFPQSWRDVSFWIKENSNFHPNDFYQLVREIGCDLIQDVSLVRFPFIIHFVD